MKRIVIVLSVLVCAVAITATAAEKKKGGAKACGCCEATVEAEKACKEECCTKAAAEGKVCEKCHPAKKAKK